MLLLLLSCLVVPIVAPAPGWDSANDVAPDYPEAPQSDPVGARSPDAPQGAPEGPPAWSEPEKGRSPDSVDGQPMGPPGIPDVATPRTKCPKQLESLTAAVTPSSWLLFNDGAVWQIDNQRIDKASKRVEELFPEGPDFVNASVTTSKGKTLLIAERTIYGYEWQEGHFRPSSGFPKSLHERVLFFPQAAIPMTNGSVVLISGNVFAMYDPETNLPQYLNDVTRYLPGLPEEIRSGVPKRAGSDDAFYVFDANNMYDYDQHSHSVRAQTPITEFFKCS